VSTSILTSTKKNLGLGADYEAFDPDIVLYINGVFSTLNQLGVGPEQGFAIEDDAATWDAFIGTDPRLNSVKTYMYLCVRLLFDPPGTSYLIAAVEKQKQELEWRLNVYKEATNWVDPEPGDDPEDDEFLDGGSA
jgi:hypothetical protein